MVTLTYRTADDWEAGQIRAYIKKTKERLGDRLISYAWVMELQKRGVPHYHVLFILKPYARIRKPDKSGDWSYGFSNVVTNVKSVFYIISYLKKSNEVTANYPKGGRIFAVWHTEKSFKEAIRRLSIPRWVIDLYSNREDFSLEDVKRKKEGWTYRNVKLHSGWKLVEFVT